MIVTADVQGLAALDRQWAQIAEAAERVRVVAEVEAAFRAMGASPVAPVRSAIAKAVDIDAPDTGASLGLRSRHGRRFPARPPTRA